MNRYLSRHHNRPLNLRVIHHLNRPRDQHSNLRYPLPLNHSIDLLLNHHLSRQLNLPIIHHQNHPRGRHLNP